MPSKRSRDGGSDTGEAGQKPSRSRSRPRTGDSASEALPAPLWGSSQAVGPLPQATGVAPETAAALAADPQAGFVRLVPGSEIPPDLQGGQWSPRPPGRPTLYTTELGARICARIASGESVRQICADEEMPHSSTVFNWSRSNDEFAAMYDRACEVWLQVKADELLDIADDASNDWMEIETRSGRVIQKFNEEAVARSRLRIQTRQWLLEKRMARVYGAKVEHKHSGTIGVEMDADHAARVAQTILAGLGQDVTDATIVAEHNGGSM